MDIIIYVYYYVLVKKNWMWRTLLLNWEWHECDKF